MTDTNYGSTSPADVQALLANIPVSTKNAILTALQENGLLQRNIDVVGVSNAGAHTQVGPGATLVTLSPGTATQVNSPRPVIIAAESGSNYVDVSHVNHNLDRADTIVGGSGSDYIVGNTAADSLVAGSGSEYIASGGGHDTIRGGSGHDTLIGGGQSQIYGGSGPATILAGQSSSAQDTIQAGSGREKITLESGNNTVYAPVAGGKATITAGSGHDTIYGPTSGQGAETINGGAYTTVNMGSGSISFNVANSKADTIFGGSQTNFVQFDQTFASSNSTSVGGQAATTFTFGSGGTVTVVGSNVHPVFPKPNS